MESNHGRRVTAFILALLFLLTTVGTSVYIILVINGEAPNIVDNTDNSSSTNQPEEQQPPSQDQSAEEQQTIENFDGPVTVDELRFDVIVEGEGEEVQPSDTVTIHYTGALASDGSVFDSSLNRGEPATFPLDNLIQGWQEGIPGMKIGEKRRLFIPSELGYGEAGSPPNIPGNADLIFDIELFATER
jgi:FKBP-type peptidyl-prolyl cis-trans isomerase FkpA